MPPSGRAPRIGDVEAAEPLQGDGAGRRSADQPAASRLPLLSVSRSEKATSVPLRLAGADQGDRLDAAIWRPCAWRRPGGRSAPSADRSCRREGIAHDAWSRSNET